MPLVYSTEFGQACPGCGKPKDKCMCRQLARTVVPETAGVVRVRSETAGRKGKKVTLITGLPLSRENLEDLAKKLKQQLGTGGAVKDSVIELQGDHRDKAGQVLRTFGYQV